MRNFFKYFANEKHASLTRVISNQNLSSYQTREEEEVEPF